MPTIVWAIEDNQEFRETLVQAINRMPGFACPRHFGTCEEALAALRAGAPPPDLTLFDVALPGMTGIEGIQEFRNVSPATQGIVLTVFEDDDKIFRALCAGAIGYLLKDASLQEIGQALRTARAGGSPMNPRIARRVLELFARQSPSRIAPAYHLSPREQSVLELLVEGRAKKEVAAALGLSIHTVDGYIRTIYEKLHVSSRGAAVAKAVKERLV